MFCDVKLNGAQVSKCLAIVRRGEKKVRDTKIEREREREGERQTIEKESKKKSENMIE